MTSEAILKSNIFIWGDVGENLRKLDDKRMLAVAQLNPNNHLAVIANNEISKIIKLLETNKGELTPEIIEAIIKSSELDNTFREVASFFKYNTDMLSIGSFITGNKYRKGKTGGVLFDE